MWSAVERETKQTQHACNTQSQQKWGETMDMQAARLRGLCYLVAVSNRATTEHQKVPPSIACSDMCTPGQGGVPVVSGVLHAIIYECKNSAHFRQKTEHEAACRQEKTRLRLWC